MTLTVVQLTGSGEWPVPAGVTSLTEVLVIGGGAGGGGAGIYGWPGGGGGAGQRRSLTNVSVSPGGSISYSVGAGGAGGALGANQGADGGATTFGTTVAPGGGGGGANTIGRNGGSGGGGSGGNRNGGVAADATYGNNGGKSTPFSTPPYHGGGGGGAGEAGADGWSPSYEPDGAKGGDGIDSSLYFSAYGVAGWFAAGGAGGLLAGDGNDSIPAVGGQGGGGDSGDGFTVQDGGDATAGTGSGGAGASCTGSAGGVGGDGSEGVILLAYEDGSVDWSADIDPITTQEYWSLEIDDGVMDAIRIPISSWQATVQLDRSNFTQAVIPGALEWVDAVNDRKDGEIIIYRGVRHQGGNVQEVELARAPLEQVQLDQGPINTTMTLRGYSQPQSPQNALTRDLQNVRSQSTSASGVRFRCDIDWLLRPGHTAQARGTTFEVAYINYYVTRGQAYMDVGERIVVAQPSPVIVTLLVGQSVAYGRAMEPIAGISATMTAGQSVAAGRVLVPDTGA